jgi:hemerythrin-like domain-containing protein
MLREHGEIWDTMAALDAELARDPGSVAVADTCRRLLEQLERHNLKEEPILYPHADRTLGAAERARLRGLLEAGRLPEGWVCARAAG